VLASNYLLMTLIRVLETRDVTILSENLKKFKPAKTYIRDHYVLPIWNMGVTAKNIEFQSMLDPNCRFSVKP
jgi:hypothetical protein